jgi:glucose-1-phosphate adenylyltransferase
MKNTLALILAGGRVDELSVLTLSRPKSAVPFGGMYRVIDFPLSNLMHSGVEKVGILSQYRSFSLVNHVGIGSWWDFVGRDRGATMLLPSRGYRVGDWYKGTADAVYQNLEFIHEQNPETVLILSGDHIYKMHYGSMLDYHLEKDADLTIAFYPIKPDQSSRFGVAEIDNEDGELGGRVLSYREKPLESEFSWASLTIYLFKPSVLTTALKKNAAADSHEFGRDIIPEMIEKKKVYGYKFNGYWGYTHTIDEFWQTNMDLLGDSPKISLEPWQVRTNLDHDCVRDRTPARIGRNAVVENSLVHNGCQVDGEVSNSILFSGVKVAEGAVVKNSVLFFDTEINSGAFLDKTITDFDVQVGTGCVIGEGSNETPNKEYPNLLKSGISLIGKDVNVPPNVQIGRNCIIYPEMKPENFEKTKIESGTILS